MTDDRKIENHSNALWMEFFPNKYQTTAIDTDQRPKNRKEKKKPYLIIKQLLANREKQWISYPCYLPTRKRYNAILQMIERDEN